MVTIEKEQAVLLRELIRVLIRKLGLLERGEASCCGITLGQCHTLVEIGRAGSISLKELAEKLYLDNSTVSRTVNNLVQSGIAERELDPEDRRYVRIRLTSKGYGIFNDIEENMEEYFAGILNSIPENKRGQLIESLQMLVGALDSSKCCKK